MIKRVITKTSMEASIPTSINQHMLTNREDTPNQLTIDWITHIRQTKRKRFKLNLRNPPRPTRTHIATKKKRNRQKPMTTFIMAITRTTTDRKERSITLTRIMVIDIRIENFGHLRFLN